MIDDDENAHREGEKTKKDERKTKDGKEKCPIVRPQNRGSLTRRRTRARRWTTDNTLPNLDHLPHPIALLVPTRPSE